MVTRRVLARQLQLHSAAPRHARPLGPDGDGRYRTASIDPYRDVLITPEPQQAAPGTVVIVEGLFLHRDALNSSWDHSIFLDVPFAVTARRMAERDGTPANPDHPQMRRYIEGQRLYYRSCRPGYAQTESSTTAIPQQPDS